MPVINITINTEENSVSVSKDGESLVDSPDYIAIYKDCCYGDDIPKYSVSIEKSEKRNGIRKTEIIYANKKDENRKNDVIGFLKSSL